MPLSAFASDMCADASMSSISASYRPFPVILFIQSEVIILRVCDVFFNPILESLSVQSLGQIY